MKTLTAVQIRQIPREAILVTDSQDVEPIKANIGEAANEFDSFFVIASDGDYDAVRGFFGIVPALNRLAYRLI